MPVIYLVLEVVDGGGTYAMTTTSTTTHFHFPKTFLLGANIARAHTRRDDYTTTETVSHHP